MTVRVAGLSGGVFGVLSPEAVGAWVRLAVALGEAGPPVCEEEPELWWSSPQSSRLEEAVFGCSRCPVREECLAYALEARERYGVWGGSTPAERQAVWRGSSA